MEGSWGDGQAHTEVNRASGLIDMNRQTEEEMKVIRDAVAHQDGLILSVLDVLRRVPRRVLMVLKLNDLTRYVYILLTETC
jgi:aarF domain-containing kinase